MIGGLVAEREARRRAAVAEIGSAWGGPQTLLGPVLVLPHRVVRKDVVPPPAPGMPASTVVTPVEKRASRLRTPRSCRNASKVDGPLVPERRRRGIFEVVVYTGSSP